MNDAMASYSGPPKTAGGKAVPPRRRLSLRKKACFAFVVFGILFLIPETLTRIIAPEYERLRFGPGLTSGFDIGQRGANYGYEKALGPKQPGEIRFAMLGDSVMWGFGLPIEQTIPARVEARLQAARPELVWRCINLAGMGTTPGLRKDFVLQNLDDWHADAIIVQFNLNDVGWDDREYVQRQVDATPGVAGLFSNGGIRLRQRYLRLSAFLALIEEKCKQAIVRARPPRDPEAIGLAANCDSPEIRARRDYQFEALAEIKRACDARGMGFAVYLYPDSERLSDDPRDNVFNVDKRRFTVDPYARFDDYMKRFELPGHHIFDRIKSEREAMLAGRKPWVRLYHIQDSNHPDATGADIMAEEIVADILAGRLVRVPSH